MQINMTYEKRLEQIQKLLKKKAMPLTIADIADELNLSIPHTWVLMQECKKEKSITAICKRKHWYFTTK